MSHIFRSIAVTLVVFLGTPQASPAPTHSEPAPRQSEPALTNLGPQARVEAVAITTEQKELVDEARSLFADASLTLPAVTIEFPTDPDACFDHGGVYIPKLRTVRMCRPSLKTMVHELAHSWIETTLTPSEREGFLELRELDTWAEGDHWDERGAEHAAEIVTWALLENDISMRWIYTNDDGTETDTTRLFKIPNSDPSVLVEAYEQLTGDLPQRRLAEQGLRVQAATQVVSPEAR